jgi:uncharacterized protein (DUF427 family)
MKPTPIAPGPGQESVWTHSRPPRIEPTTKRLTVVVAGRTVAGTLNAFRVLETSHPPVYHFPLGDVDESLLRPDGGSTSCEWKGQATYFDTVVGDIVRPRAAWSYPQPTADSMAIKNFIAFYPALADLCTVDGVKVVPQPGGFYGGWITPDLAGPFKGGPGSMGW